MRISTDIESSIGIESGIGIEKVPVSKSIEIPILQEKSIGIGIELKKSVSHTPVSSLD